MDTAEIRAKLEAKLKSLKERAEAIDDDLQEPRDDDWDENASESGGDEVQAQVSSIAREEVRKIEAALARIKAGTYGACARCGGAIAAKRLEALPYATTCVSCV